MISLSHSQELEDINMFKKTWTCSSTSKITLTLISATPSTWLTSSRLLTPSERTSLPNITMVNSVTQLPAPIEVAAELAKYLAPIRVQKLALSLNEGSAI